MAIKVFDLGSVPGLEDLFHKQAKILSEEKGKWFRRHVDLSPTLVDTELVFTKALEFGAKNKMKFIQVVVFSGGLTHVVYQTSE